MALWKRLETNCRRGRSKSNRTPLGRRREPSNAGRPANVSRWANRGVPLPWARSRHPGVWVRLYTYFDLKMTTNGGLAQLVERVLSMHEAVDSISTFSMSNFPHAPVAPHSPLMGCVRGVPLPTCQVLNFFMSQVSICHPISSAMRCVRLNGAVSGVQPAANSEMPCASG